MKHPVNVQNEQEAIVGLTDDEAYALDRIQAIVNDNSDDHCGFGQILLNTDMEQHRAHLKALAEFKDFATDFFEHFEHIPTDFEDSTGKEYNADQCWSMACELGINEWMKKFNVENKA